MSECPGVLVEDANGDMRCSRGSEGCLAAYLLMQGDTEEFREAHRPS